MSHDHQEASLHMKPKHANAAVFPRHRAVLPLRALPSLSLAGFSRGARTSRFELLTSPHRLGAASRAREPKPFSGSSAEGEFGISLNNSSDVLFSSPY